MDEFSAILARLEQLADEVRELKAGNRESKSNPLPSERTFLPLADSIRHIIAGQNLPPKGKFICHSVLDEETGKASVQLTWLEAITEDDSYSAAQFCQALASEHRINMLKAMSLTEMSTTELSQKIGIEGGPLYHHLKELSKAKFIYQKGRSRYQITDRGLDALLTVCALNRRNTLGEQSIWLEETENES